MRWFVWCVMWWSLASAGIARDIHVDNLAGDDRLDGSASRGVIGIGGPVQTIAKALRLAEGGDRVVVVNTGQPYRESLSLTGTRHSGSEAGPFVIQGNGATLDGSADVPVDAWSHFRGDVFCFQPSKLGFQQFFIRGRLAVQHPTTAAAVSLPELEPLEWCLWNGKIYFCVEAGQLPDAYQPACCEHQTGVTLYHVHDVVVENLIIQGFQVDGVNAIDAVRDGKLNALNCRANGRSGISVGGASRVELNACSLSDNGEEQLRSAGYAQTRVYESELIADTAPAIGLHGGQVSVDGKAISGSEQ